MTWSTAKSGDMQIAGPVALLLFKPDPPCIAVRNVIGFSRYEQRFTIQSAGDAIALIQSLYSDAMVKEKRHD